MSERRIAVCDPITGRRVVGTLERRDGMWPFTFRAVIEGLLWEIPCDGEYGYMITPADWQSPGEWEDRNDVLYLPIVPRRGGLEGVSA
jgi:hypothetical protein